MSARRSFWLLYGAGIVVLLVAFVVLSVLVLRLDGTERTLRDEITREETRQVALWRLESWISARLAPETRRPHFDYFSFYPQPRAYTKLLYTIEPGEVLTPSPLLSFESEIFRLHFQIAPDGSLISPQVPTGNHLDLAQGTMLTPERLARNRARLEEVRRQLGGFDLADRIARSELSHLGLAPPPREPTEPPVDRQQLQVRAQNEFSNRQWAVIGTNNAALPIDVPKGAPVEVGPLLPFFAPVDDERELFFARRVRLDGEEYVQGILCSWSRIEQELLDLVSDLTPDARLTPLDDPEREVDDERRLASIPALLETTVAGASSLPVGRSSSSVQVALVLVWLAVLLGVAGAAFSLRSSIRFGEARSRFASAVTHELRTPLTTFRMYTEMLTDGMVSDPAQRDEYLMTLKDESARLSGLVENVLCYARVEEGRHRPRAEALAIGSLLTRIQPTLEQRASSAGLDLRLDWRASKDVEVSTDPEGVSLILFNLIDNAAKYAANGAGDRRVHLIISESPSAVDLAVRDHGPGVPEADRDAIFRAFEQGSHDDEKPRGIGLGLALSREIARELGGELQLIPLDEPGACFRLRLPR